MEVRSDWNFAWRCRGRSAVVQIASNQAAILQLDNPENTKVLTVLSAIKGVDLWKQYYLIWKLNDAEIFELTSQGIEHLAKIGIVEGAHLAIHNRLVFMTVDDGVQVLSFKGERKQMLLVDEYQGKALHLEVCEEALVAVTSENRIRLWKVRAHTGEVKAAGLPSGRKVDEVAGKIHSVRCNCDGTKVSVLADEKLLVYDDYLDKFLCYEFENGKPVSVCWDDEDCRLLACQMVSSEVEDSEEFEEKETASSVIFTFFVTSDYPQGIFEYEKSRILCSTRKARLYVVMNLQLLDLPR